MKRLDDLAEKGILRPFYLSKSRGGRWAASMQAKEMPSVSGKPMYEWFPGDTPSEAIEAALARLEEKPQTDHEDLI